MFSSTRLVPVALAATLLFAACGSDDDTSGAGSDTVSTEATVADTTPAAETTVADTTPDTTEAAPDDTTATTDAPEQDIAADTAAAEAAVLTLANFPEGWTETPAGDVAEIDGRVAECVGGDGAEAVASTGKFASPDGNLVVGETVDVRASERDARLVIAQITNPEVPDCIAAAYAELGAAALSAGVLPEGAEIGEVTAARLPVGAAGDATQAIRVTIAAASGDPAGQVTVDQVFVRSGRSLATISFESTVEPTPVETIDGITTAAAELLPV
jgi:hypothetical protein